MWLAPAGDGYASRACLIPPTLSSLMRVCCRATEGVQHELEPFEAAWKMGAGPPGSAFRSRSQTSPSCCGKEPWW
jgi:hypothetical protein